MLAFFVVVDGFDDMVVCAATMPKARYLAWRGAQEAGYKSVTFQRIRCSRAKDLDGWAEKQEKPRLIARSTAEWEAR
jgi:hypothetical protein